MTSQKQSRGTCAYCGKEYAKGGMTRHLTSCAERKAAIAAAEAGQTHPLPIFQLLVEDAWSSEFWLHLEMRGDALLEDLDHYLRAIWLECCGHLSAFEIGPVRYTQLYDDGFGWGEEEGMDVAVGKLFTPGMAIPYEYDFGTTSRLDIVVKDERRGAMVTAHPIALLGRNNLPDVQCALCSKPPTLICQNCLWNGGDVGYLFCAEHAKDHECDDEYLMGIYNSPRTGMCGYDGPAEPPY